MRLSGKNALVTGGDQGIGRGIALRLATEGADVGVNYRQNRDGAEEVRSEIEKMGRRAVVIQADVGQTADARRVVEDAVAALGWLDILVNNAGIEKRADFVDVTEDDYSSVIAVNMTGPFFSTQ